MKLGIIGAGMIGRAVAAVVTKAGHEVMLSNSRSPKTLFSLCGTLGCRAGTPEEAAAFGDIVLVAIPLEAYRTIPAAPLAGKIVLDANNYYFERDGHIDELDRGETTTSELVARQLPHAKVVKVFNAIQAGDIERCGTPAGTKDRRAQPIAGDDAEAKLIVVKLLDEIGFDVVDAGPLKEGFRFQKDTSAYCVPLNAVQLKDALAAA
jgi:predicted dinucleotide-binding enzyme